MCITERIKQKLTAALAPEHLELVNESHKHKGHAGDDGSGETHYNLMVVSDCFADCNRIQRHRMVFSLLNEEFKDGLHALSLKALTPSEYKNQ